MSAPAGYKLVLPAVHHRLCRRGMNPASEHYGLDRVRCARCRALWDRLGREASERRKAST